MPAKQKPTKPKNIAYTVFVGPDEYAVLTNNKVIHIHPNTGEQKEYTLAELDIIRETARETLYKLQQTPAVKHTPREKSQEILARQEREKKAR